ncbi:hypothetical protein C0Q70_19409 [Pomacea canaliculata]|uniref:Uncharacterized protein n=1 Tax=Pomacea canaliculata TaxID=400727 RepID=A0A2T7NJA5_POMCA|nr:hypothetical protein C0Q70_19409 [Pomacea canaliculata]
MDKHDTFATHQATRASSANFFGGGGGGGSGGGGGGGGGGDGGGDDGCRICGGPCTYPGIPRPIFKTLLERSDEGSSDEADSLAVPTTSHNLVDCSVNKL